MNVPKDPVAIKRDLELKEKSIGYAAKKMKVKNYLADPVDRSVVVNALAHGWYIGYRHAQTEKNSHVQDLYGQWKKALDFYLKDNGGPNHPKRDLISFAFIDAYWDGIRDLLAEK